MKEDTQDENEENRWRRKFGGIYKEEFLNLLKEFDPWFFEDSGFQICLREPEVKGYFAYDEHGIFFIYDKKQLSKELELLGLKKKIKPLLSDKPHWHVRPKDCEKIYSDFKAALKDRSEFYDEEAEHQTH